jgi:EAL domain-containing protein (putative c-di-GMP-specific phosphodiesterase class I)
MEQGNPLTATDGALVNFDAVCQRVRAAMEPARAHAVSLHDERGDILWLTESSMGPDEHNAVREAMAVFAKRDGPPILTYDLGEARSAVLLRVVNAGAAMVGAIMVVMDTRAIRQDSRGPIRLITPKLQRALAEFAQMRPAVAAVPPHRPPAPPPPRAAASPAVRPAARPAARPAPIARPAARPAAAPQRRAQAVTPEIERLHAALRRTPIGLHVQRLMPLAKGTQLQRFEVLLRSKSSDAPNSAPHAMLKAAVEHGLGSMIDRRVLTELMGWLVRNKKAWQANGALFSVNLTATALHDDHFIKFVELCLMKSQLPRGTIAFEIDVPTAVKLAARIHGVAVALHRLGCPLVLDDFALRTECFALLRLPGVRYVKLAPEITAKMRTDKVAQAAITAVVQMSRVLGMHTVAKHAETPPELEWLTALGVDFVQSHALAPPVAIDSLARP